MRVLPKYKARVLAIDPGLTVSGWAVLDAQSGGLLLCGTTRPPGPSIKLETRLEVFQSLASSLFSRLALTQLDAVVCEAAAPLVLNPASAEKVERVRSTWESVARANSVPVLERVNPRTIQTQMLGLRGAQAIRADVKRIARSVAQHIFGQSTLGFVELEHGREWEEGRLAIADLTQDAIDALLLGSYAVTLIKRGELEVQSGLLGDIGVRSTRRGSFVSPQTDATDLSAAYGLGRSRRSGQTPTSGRGLRWTAEQLRQVGKGRREPR